MTNNKAYLAAIINAIIIGLSFLFVKMTLEFAEPLDTLAHRFTIAFIAATIFLLVKKIKIEADFKEIMSISLVALFYPVGIFAFQAFGLVYTSSSEAGIIQATLPIITLVFAYFILKEKANSKQILAMILSVIGVIFIFSMKGTSYQNASMLGSILILLSAMSNAMYNVLARKYSKKYALFTMTYIMICYGFVAFNLIALGTHLINGSITTYFEPFLNLKFVCAILYLGVLSSLLTSYFSNYALSKISAAQMSIFSNISTLITILAGIIVLQESFYWYHIVGSILIILGAFMANYFAQK